MIHDLNFPPFDFRVHETDGKLMIFDRLRKKSVVLTPEEWVRQHLVRYLIDYKNYPASMIRVESGLKYDKLPKRSDILVFDRQGVPFLVVECKSPEVKLDDRALHQLAAYSKSLRTPFAGVSNGMKHFCWEIDHGGNTTKPLSDFPAYTRSGDDLPGSGQPGDDLPGRAQPGDDQLLDNQPGG